MKIRILGSGWYGCTLATFLIKDGHTVEIHEVADRIFAGASGANPARLHTGSHYPRSGVTRALCQDHTADFLNEFGFLTRNVPSNLYCIADRDSLIDFPTYKKILQGEVDFIEVYDPKEYGLSRVEGAILTNERHIVINLARMHFDSILGDRIKLNTPIGDLNDPAWDFTIDCTFSALNSDHIDRYEPCIMALLSGPTDTAVTIMDGQFPSLYPWDEEMGLSSLTSAKWTPLAKDCRTYAEARMILENLTTDVIESRGESMMDQMQDFWPDVRDLYHIVDYRLGIRAMPYSASDARLPKVVRISNNLIRVCAGKIDAAIYATAQIQSILKSRVMENSHLSLVDVKREVARQYGLRKPPIGRR